MPELPEVEIVKLSLDRKIKLKKIKKVIIKNRNLRFKIPLKFEELLQNKIIKKVTRFSKYLILNFSNDSFCLKIKFHLHKYCQFQIQIFDLSKNFLYLFFYQKNISTNILN